MPTSPCSSPPEPTRDQLVAALGEALSLAYWRDPAVEATARYRELNALYRSAKAERVRLPADRASYNRNQN